MKLKSRLLLILVVIGVVLVWKSVPDWLIMQKPAVDITDLWDCDLDEIKPGTHICLDVTLVWSQVGSSIEQSKTMGVTTSERVTGHYYVLPLCSWDDDNMMYPTPFLLTSLPTSYESTMLTQIEKTENWWESNADFDSVPTCSIHLDGVLNKIPSNMKKQINSNLLSSGESFDEYFVDCMFRPIASPASLGVMALIGFACCIAAGLIFFLSIRAGSGKPTYGAGPNYVPNGVAYTPQTGATDAPVYNGSTGATGSVTGTDAAAGAQTGTQSFASAFGSAPVQGSSNAFGSSPVQGSSSAFGSTPVQGSTPAFGSTPAQGSTTAYGTAPVQGSTPAYGSAPVQGSTPAFGSTPVQGNSSAFGSTPAQGSTPAYGTSPVQGSTSAYGSAPVQNNTPAYGAAAAFSAGKVIEEPDFFGEPPKLNIKTEEEEEAARKAAEAAEKRAAEEEETRKALAAFTAAMQSSRGSTLPLGGDTDIVASQASQGAVLPLGTPASALNSSPAPLNINTTDSPSPMGATAPMGPSGSSPVTVGPYSSGSSAPAQPYSFGSSAPAQSSATAYGSAPAQGSTPLYGSVPAQSSAPVYGTAPVQPAAPAVPDENAPQYADNSDLKSMIGNAFASSNNQQNN